jgi:hypothetical protein
VLAGDVAQVLGQLAEVGGPSTSSATNQWRQDRATAPPDDRRAGRSRGAGDGDGQRDAEGTGDPADESE